MRHMNQAIEELKQANANLHVIDRNDNEAKNKVSEAREIISVAAERLGIVSRMIEFVWSSETTKDPLALADAIEIAVAFAGGEFYGRFSQANFQHALASEVLSDDNFYIYIWGSSRRSKPTI